MADVTMIDLCKAALPKVYYVLGDIVEIQRLAAAKYVTADAAVMSRSLRISAHPISITVNAVTVAGRALVSMFPRKPFSPEAFSSAVRCGSSD